MRTLFFPLAWMGLIAMSSSAWGWADHDAITAAALQPLSALSGATVPYTELGELVKDLGYAKPRDFAKHILIAQSYGFQPRLGEKAGKAVAVKDILSKYSDEPDWGMDQELFSQYPELWDPAYSMMGDGVPSQAFRHMYWQKLSLFHFLKTFKLPLNKEFKSMGQAPERAALFLQLAREAHEKGHPYWAVRFVADALHYLEDCSQPYHTSQVPTKEFVFIPFFNRYGHGLSRYVEQMTNIVSYYHLSFEDYVSELMLGAMHGDGNIPGSQFIQDLRSVEKAQEALDDLDYKDQDIARMVRVIAGLGMKESAAAGRMSIRFFPPIEEDFLTMDPRFTDHQKGLPFAADHKTGFEDDAWWARAQAAGAKDTPARNEYFRIVSEMFGPLGYAVRQVVTEVTGSQVARRKSRPGP